MSFSSVFAGRQQAKRSQVLARAACVESLENRTLLSTFYVATTGADSGAGSLTAPFKTVQYALNQAQSGDTITVRGGTYNLSSEIRIYEPNITIQGYEGETAKLVAPTSNSSIEVAVRVGEDAHNTKLINLDISGGYYYALKTESLVDTGAPSEYGPKNLLVSRSKLHDSGRDVIKLTPKTDYSIIEFCEIYNSGRRDASNAEGIDAVQANYAILRDSYIHDTTTNGVYYKGGDIGTMIERNRVANTAHSGILLGQSTDENWFDLAKNPKMYESIDAVVRNNVVWNTEGAGIGAWAALRPQIYNNTMYNVARSMFGGLLVQGQEHWPPGVTGNDGVIIPSTDVTMYNNIVVVSGSRPALEVRDGGLTGYLKSDYNYFYDTNSAASFTNYVNGVSGGLAAWKAAGFDTHSYEGNPGVDTSNLYHLTSSSPAINKGMTLSLVASDYDKEARPASGSYDIGADEFGGTPTTPTNPTPTDPTPTDPTPTDPTPTDPTPTDPTPTNGYANTAVATQTGKFTMRVAAKAAQRNKSVIFGISSGAADQVADMTVAIRFNSAGVIDVRTGGAWKRAVAFKYKAGVTYQFRAEVDLATRKFDVFVTDPTTNKTTKITAAYSVNNGATSVNNFVKMNANGGNITTGTPTFQSTTTTVTAPSTTTDLAQGKVATASSIEGAGLEASKVNDGSDSTRWASGTTGTSWVSVDLGATYSLTSVKLNWEYASASAYQIQVSSDGVNWTTVSSQTNAPQGGWTTSTFSATGRFVRVLCTAATTEWGYSLYSMQVFGK